ncbi:hypothetical protein ILYODFUR_036852 [Ilyodon furcidens]|uniref:Exosome complex component N-terminal domain-containing protein n=1 Tax=Ilyodon furcidens TaxID=33524 RepID=A0ABV0V9S5_9TELE
MRWLSALPENMSPLRLCVPGEKLCSVEDCSTGTGVYQRHGYIYSSLAGYVLRKNEGEEVRIARQSKFICVTGEGDRHLESCQGSQVHTEA